MKKQINVLAMIVTLTVAAGVVCQAQTAAGNLDPTFGSGGKTTLDISESDEASAVLIQPSDGKIIVAGGAIVPNGYGAFFDFAKEGKALTAGDVYRASVGASQIIFKVDPYAAPGAAPIVSRLLRFQPAG